MKNAKLDESNHRTEPNDLWNLFLENVLWNKKRFHLICIAVVVGCFVLRAILSTRDSIYIMAHNQLFGIGVISITLLVWLYEKVKDKEREEDVSNIMTAWYLGFALAIVLLYGIYEIEEKDRTLREMRIKMTDEEWDDFNEQIREDARQDYYEYRHP